MELLIELGGKEITCEIETRKEIIELLMELVKERSYDKWDVVVMCCFYSPQILLP